MGQKWDKTGPWHLTAQLVNRVSSNPPVPMYRQFSNFQLKQVLQVTPLWRHLQRSENSVRRLIQFQNHKRVVKQVFIIIWSLWIQLQTILCCSSLTWSNTSWTLSLGVVRLKCEKEKNKVKDGLIVITVYIRHWIQRPSIDYRLKQVLHNY